MVNRSLVNCLVCSQPIDINENELASIQEIL
jgi:hypothetical protein